MNSECPWYDATTGVAMLAVHTPCACAGSTARGTSSKSRTIRERPLRRNMKDSPVVDFYLPTLVGRGGALSSVVRPWREQNLRHTFGSREMNGISLVMSGPSAARILIKGIDLEL